MDADRGEEELHNTKNDAAQELTAAATTSVPDGTGAGGTPPRGACPHAYLRSLPIRSVCSVVSSLLVGGATTFLFTQPESLVQALSVAGLVTAAALTCGIAHSGILPANPAAADSDQSVLEVPCADARRAFANTAFAGLGAGALIVGVFALRNRGVV